MFDLRNSVTRASSFAKQPFHPAIHLDAAFPPSGKGNGIAILIIKLAMGRMIFRRAFREDGS